MILYKVPTHKQWQNDPAHHIGKTLIYVLPCATPFKQAAIVPKTMQWVRVYKITQWLNPPADTQATCLNLNSAPQTTSFWTRDLN